ncbi:MAG: hypothetical protein IJ514_05405 [Clostridia bacterium]|nr:hypothetical protein [Clostridia bacterium]
MKRNSKICTLLAMATVCCGFAFASCENSAEVTLQDFADTQMSAVLGEECTLPSSAISTAGAKYAVDYTAKTKSGETVTVENSEFVVEYLEEHTLTASVKITESDVRTRTITLSVTDEHAPVISFSDATIGHVGSVYTLPTVDVLDDSGETVLPTVKLYKYSESGVKGVEVGYANGVFTPQDKGLYLLEATAKDSSGNEAVLGKILYVDTVSLQSFENAATSVVLGGEYTPPSVALGVDGTEYEVSYDVVTSAGRKLGLLDGKLFVRYYETHYLIASVQAGGGAVHIRTITVNVTDEGAPEIVFGEAQTGEINSEYVLPSVTVVDDSRETITPDLKLFAYSEKGVKGDEIYFKNGAFTPSASGYYLLEATAQDSSGNESTTASKILYVRSNEVSATEIVSFDDPEDATWREGGYVLGNIGVSNNYKPTVTWQHSFAGETGVMQLVHHSVEKEAAYDTWSSQFTIYNSKQDLGIDSDIYDQYDYLVVKMFIVKNAEYQVDWDYVAIQERSKCKTATLTADDYNQWITLKFPLSQVLEAQNAVIDNAETKAYNDAIKAGKTEEEALEAGATARANAIEKAKRQIKIYGQDAGAAAKTGDNAYTNQVGMFYVADVYLEGVEPNIVLTEDNFETYVTEKGNSSTEHKWNGVANAVQVDYDGDEASQLDKYPGFTLRGLWNYDTVKAKGYDYFTVQVYIVNGVDPYDASYVPETTLGNSRYMSVTVPDKIRLMKMSGGLSSGSSDKGQWNTYVLPLECLKSSSMDIWGELATLYGTARMYVKNIELKKAELDVEVTGVNGLYVNETLTVSVTENGEAVDSFMACAAKEGGGNQATVTNGTTSISIADDWYVFVVSGDKVGYTRITVSEPTATE